MPVVRSEIRAAVLQGSVSVCCRYVFIIPPSSPIQLLAGLSGTLSVRVPMSYRQIVKRYDAAEILMLTSGVILVVAIVFAIQW